MRYWILILTLWCAGNATAQVINNATAYRNIQRTHYVRHNYENDFFTKTDKYYTQGINMEGVTPAFGKLPTRYLLLHPSNSKVQYGLALQHNAYTPTSIQDATIRYGDRPYAAAAMIQPFSISTDEVRKQRMTTMLSLGVTGQIAGGQWMQETIHRNLDNVMPQGWQYQIANDAVVNYRLYYEKRLLRLGNVLELSGTALADAGTLNTRAGAGAHLMIGYFESPYSTTRNRRFAAYVYTHAQAFAIGYDATLQGGLLSNSVYTIPGGDVSRWVGSNIYGVVLRYGGVYVEYFQANRTRSFATGNPHAWGAVQLGAGFEVGK